MPFHLLRSQIFRAAWSVGKSWSSYTTQLYRDYKNMIRIPFLNQPVFYGMSLVGFSSLLKWFFKTLKFIDAPNCRPIFLSWIWAHVGFFVQQFWLPTLQKNWWNSLRFQVTHLVYFSNFHPMFSSLLGLLKVIFYVVPWDSVLHHHLGDVFILFKHLKQIKVYFHPMFSMPIWLMEKILHQFFFFF